jgi:hypothetical protein
MAKMEMGMLWNTGGGDPNVMDEGTKQKVEEYIGRRVGDLVCPDHGEPPTIICSGTRLDNLSFDVKGCCQKLIYTVKRKLEE